MSHSNKIIIDLDGVIAGPKPLNGSYDDCEPNGAVIRRLRELQSAGFSIAIFTSRNVRTFDHNFGKLNAVTVPSIVSWLDKHQVPYDEVWPGKPWTGATGFYVDDKAVSIKDFLTLSPGQIGYKTEAAAFNPQPFSLSIRPKQVWSMIDLRENTGRLANKTLLTLIKSHQLFNERTYLALPPNYAFAIGYDEELTRLGVRWGRFDKRLSVNEVWSIASRELSLSGDANPNHPLRLVTPGANHFQSRATSRHFNSVIVDHETQTVTKTAKGLAKTKLAFESAWFKAALHAGVSKSVLPENVEVVEEGYQLKYYPTGSLNELLLRQSLNDTEIRVLASAIEKLWTGLSVDKPNSTPETNHSWVPGPQQNSEHKELIVDKSMRRLKELEPLLKDAAGIGIATPWTVNNHVYKPLNAIVSELVKMIPVQEEYHRGILHGDLCPGNILVSEGGLRVIDPRGTTDSKIVALYGDRRYDLAKLAHALLYGYDALVEGWYDVHWWTSSPSANFNVRLSLWDDQDDFTQKSSRFKLWDLLLQSDRMSVGGVRISDKEIHALAALQLITCAPLHSDDPRRMIALICRGLTAYFTATMLPKPR